MKVLKQHNVDGEPGLVQRYVNRCTNATISFWFNEQAGLAGEKPYTLRCETHGVDVPVASQGEAKMLLSHPGGWCSACAPLEDNA